MKVKKNLEKHPVIDKLLKIMKDRDLKQERMAEFAGVDPSQFSKILSGNVQISLWQLSNIATNLNLRIIDIFTFPDIYIKSKKDDEKTKILIEFEVNRKDLVELELQNKVFKIVDK